MTNPPSLNNKFLAWHEAEKQIQEEINWLKQSIETFSNEEKYAPITCKECLLRRIAVLIVNGKSKTSEIEKDDKLKSFWMEKGTANKIKIYHGQEWHSEKMELIENHFIQQGFSVDREPNLQFGRADLGVHKQGEADLFIEVGTTSLFKLWFNLEKMKNFVYLIVPNDNKLLEFRYEN